MSLTGFLSFVIAVAVAALPTAVLPLPLGVPAQGRGVVLGHAVGSLILVASGLLIAILCAPVPPGLLAYIGLVPLVRGGRRLLTGSIRPEATDPVRAAGPAWAMAARAWLEGGSDAFVAVAPLFATHAGDEIVALGGALVVATIAASAARSAMAERPALAKGIAALLPRFVPWTLVAIGGYVMVEGGLFNWLIR